MLPPRSKALSALALLAVTAGLSGCSLQKFVARKTADAFAETGTTYASDDDPELVRDALPFGLKTGEGLLETVPEHEGLLLTLASGFTQYAYAFVAQDADMLEESDRAAASEERARAKRLYVRARDYGMRALEVAAPRFGATLREDPDAALAMLGADEIASLYWTAAAWGAAIASDKNDLDMVADLHLVKSMGERALELDETFEEGALHDFMLTLNGSLSSAQGGAPENAERHFERALELSGGERIGSYVTLAETVAVDAQDRARYVELLETALAFDADGAPRFRLANLIAQRRARMLLERQDDLFLD